MCISWLFNFTVVLRMWECVCAGDIYWYLKIHVTIVFVRRLLCCQLLSSRVIQFFFALVRRNFEIDFDQLASNWSRTRLFEREAQTFTVGRLNQVPSPLSPFESFKNIAKLVQTFVTLEITFSPKQTIRNFTLRNVVHIYNHAVYPIVDLKSSINFIFIHWPRFQILY